MNTYRVLQTNNKFPTACVIDIRCLCTGLDVDSIVVDLGRVMEYSNRKQAQLTGQKVSTKEYSASDVAEITATACRLLSFACQVGWASVAELLLNVAQTAGHTGDDLALELTRLSDKGLSLLHHVVRSRNAGLVSMLILITLDIKTPLITADITILHQAPLHAQHAAVIKVLASALLEVHLRHAQRKSCPHMIK